MTRKQFKALADKRYQTDILTPLERRRKALDMKGLPKEKIEEVQALIDSGELITQTLRALAGAEGEHVADDHALGTAVGMLTAAELLLGGCEP